MWNKIQTAAHNLSLSKWSNTIALVSNLRQNCFFAKDLVPTYLVPICGNKVYCFCCSGTGITSFAFFFHYNFRPDMRSFHKTESWCLTSRRCPKQEGTFLQGCSDRMCRDILLHLKALSGFWFTSLFYSSDLLFSVFFFYFCHALHQLLSRLPLPGSTAKKRTFLVIKKTISHSIRQRLFLKYMVMHLPFHKRL